MAATPQYRYVGDDWSFAVQFQDATGTPIPLTGGLAPGGEFFQAFQSAPLDLTIDTGGITITDAPSGRIAASVARAITAAIVPQTIAATTFPTRLQFFLTDSLGHRQTYALVGVVPIDPRSADLNAIPAATTIVAMAGPAGPQGPAGSSAPSLLNALVFG